MSVNKFNFGDPPPSIKSNRSESSSNKLFYCSNGDQCTFDERRINTTCFQDRRKYSFDPDDPGDDPGDLNHKTWFNNKIYTQADNRNGMVSQENTKFTTGATVVA